jgi:hypothetical protein
VKHLDDRRRCPHCRRDINERPYLMSRRAAENVLAARLICWVVVAAMLLLVLVQN